MDIDDSEFLVITKVKNFLPTIAERQKERAEKASKKTNRYQVEQTEEFLIAIK